MRNIARVSVLHEMRHDFDALSYVSVVMSHIRLMWKWLNGPTIVPLYQKAIRGVKVPLEYQKGLFSCAD
jgi:hypothetical protein